LGCSFSFINRRRLSCVILTRPAININDAQRCDAAPAASRVRSGAESSRHNQRLRDICCASAANYVRTLCESYGNRR